MGIGFLAKDNTGIPSFRFTSLEAAPCPEDGPCAGMEGENLEYCNHFVDGCMAHLPPDESLDQCVEMLFYVKEYCEEYRDTSETVPDCIHNIVTEHQNELYADDDHYHSARDDFHDDWPSDDDWHHDDHQHHHHHDDYHHTDDHSSHDDGDDDDHNYDDDHDDYEDEDRVACDSNDDCNGGFCNFDNGDLGFCEPCYHFGSVEECKNSGLPDAGADACVHRCFDGGEHIKLNAAEKKKMENYRTYKAKKAEKKKKHLKLSISAQHHGDRHEKVVAASKKSVANEKDKLEEKEAQLEKSVHDKQQRQKERAIQVSKYLKEKKAAKKEKDQMKK